MEIGARRFASCWGASKKQAEQLAATEEGLARARRIYERAGPGYHPVVRRTIEEILGPDG